MPVSANGTAPAFDLRAATQAARGEATGRPFKFKWGRHVFEIPPMSTWPLEISAEFASFADTDNVPPERLFKLLERIVGEDDWPRFAATVPIDAVGVLIEAMSPELLGGTAADLSQPPEPDSTLT